jgi:hypothetical protein
MVGAKIPSDTWRPSRSSCDGRVSTWPIGRQLTRSRLLKMGTPGKYAKLDVTR